MDIYTVLTDVTRIKHFGYAVFIQKPNVLLESQHLVTPQNYQTHITILLNKITQF